MRSVNCEWAFISCQTASGSTQIPLDPWLPRLVAENLLDVCNISSLCCLEKVLLFPHGTWVGDRMVAFAQNTITICMGEVTRSNPPCCFALAAEFGLAPVLIVWLRYFQGTKKKVILYFRKKCPLSHGPVVLCFNFIGSARKSQNISSPEFLK